MKRLILAAALLPTSTLAIAANPFANVPGYGQVQEFPGYIVTCRVDYSAKPYTYWFANGFDRVAISRLGLPNGVQLFARVVDGERLSNGFDLLLRTEVGQQYHVYFNGKKGYIENDQEKVGCVVAKTSFVV